MPRRNDAITSADARAFERILDAQGVVLHEIAPVAMKDRDRLRTRASRIGWTAVAIVGALLVMSLLITPGAAAAQITASPRRAVVYSVVFAELYAVGGMLLWLAPGVPVSVFVAIVSFGIYLVCRCVRRYRYAR